MSLRTFASAAILAMGYIVNAEAEWQAGGCPEMGINKTEFNKGSMAGMWFEYVWDTGFTDDYGYQCSTWLVLDDGTGNYIVYNHMQFEEEDKDPLFHQFWLKWDEKTESGQRARAKYTR